MKADWIYNNKVNFLALSISVVALL